MARNQSLHAAFGRCPFTYSSSAWLSFIPWSTQTQGKNNALCKPRFECLQNVSTLDQIGQVYMTLSAASSFSGTVGTLKISPITRKTSSGQIAGEKQVFSINMMIGTILSVLGFAMYSVFKLQHRREKTEASLPTVIGKEELEKNSSLSENLLKSSIEV